MLFGQAILVLLVFGWAKGGLFYLVVTACIVGFINRAKQPYRAQIASTMVTKPLGLAAD